MHLVCSINRPHLILWVRKLGYMRSSYCVRISSTPHQHKVFYHHTREHTFEWGLASEKQLSKLVFSLYFALNYKLQKICQYELHEFLFSPCHHIVQDYFVLLQMNMRITPQKNVHDSVVTKVFTKSSHLVVRMYLKRTYLDRVQKKSA